MAIHKILLMPDSNGHEEEVTLNTSINLCTLYKLQSEGLLSKHFINDLILMEKDPKNADFNVMLSAPYLAYRNANPGGMSIEEWNQRIPPDLEFGGEIYAELINGEVKKAKMQQSFKQAAKNGKKNQRKKYHK